MPPPHPGPPAEPGAPQTPLQSPPDWEALFQAGPTQSSQDTLSFLDGRSAVSEADARHTAMCVLAMGKSCHLSPPSRASPLFLHDHVKKPTPLVTHPPPPSKKKVPAGVHTKTHA